MLRPSRKEGVVHSEYLSCGVYVPSFTIKQDRNRWWNFLHYTLQGIVSTWSELLEERNIRFVASGKLMSFVDNIHTKSVSSFGTLLFNLNRR